jgi:DNA polymerase-3 subunit epsilon
MRHDFVTLDFETTGLTPSTNRVIEIGIVRTSPSGRVIEQFSTLVNPGRDVGRSDIHGITAGFLRDAPRFEEISGEVVNILNGGVLVAHNASFDLRFLKSELMREGRPFSEIDALCTLELMYASFPKGPRKLVHCCEFLGIEIREAHCALDDALMTSELLHRLLEVDNPVYLPSVIEIESQPKAISNAVGRIDVVHPRAAESSYLSSLISKLPDDGVIGVSSAVSAAQYLNLLDRILEDRKIDQGEADELVRFAREVGLNSDRIAGLNSVYMANLCAVAASDGIVTESEKNDLATVAVLLDVDEWEPLLEVPLRTPESHNLQSIPAGTAVCFTGAMAVERSEIESLAKSRGLTVKPGVSRKLDLLVVADADSLSTKAKKARELGIRIIHESVFMQMLDGAN